MVNRRVKCKYRYEVSHRNSYCGVNTVTRFAKKANVLACKTISEAWVTYVQAQLMIQCGLQSRVVNN